MINHFELIEKTIQGIKTEQTPVAFWRHFPVDDQSPDTLAKATFEFQRTFDFDFVKISPSSSFCIKDWGAIDEWKGHPEGVRDYIKHPFNNPGLLENIAPLDPKLGFLGKQLECCNLLRNSIPHNTPLLQTVFSPIAQLKNLVGKINLPLFFRTHPDLTMHALRIITQTTGEWILQLFKTGVDGVFYATQLADLNILTRDEYRLFGRPFDIQLLNICGDFRLNLLHIHGSDIMFDEMADYPVQIFNWDQSAGELDLKGAQSKTNTVVCGGMERITTMLLGDTNEVERAFLDAMRQTDGKHFILGANCVLMQATPYGNIDKAVRLARHLD